MSTFASIRPDDVNVALLVHVLGAMTLVGGLVTGVAASFLGWRDETGTLRRVGYKSLLYAALPGWVAMRIGAEWTFVQEQLDDAPELKWVELGTLAADLGGGVLLLALVLGGVGLRRTRTGGGEGLLRASAVLAAVLVATYVVAVWAMGAKPT